MPAKNVSVETKKRILDSASRIFAEKSYRGATIADICRQAGANIASVNYHFGDKEHLYVETWLQAFRHTHERYPVFGDATPGDPPEKRLHGWITAMIGRASDPSCVDFEIMQREMVSPTGLLIEPIRKAIDPLKEEMDRLLGELLGPDATEEDIRLCEMSIHSQCMNPVIFHRRGTFERKGFPSPPSHDDIETQAISEHIYAFSIAGLEAARRRIETRNQDKIETGAVS